MKNPITSTVIILLLAVSSLSAATRHVRPGMPIQAVINASAAGDLILFDSGVYAGGLVVSKPLTLQSVNGPQFTVIDGGGRNPCVSGGSLFGFTLTGGYEMLAGGGAQGSTLYNCILTNNSAGDEGGGAEWCTLYNCTLVGNSIGLYGGGACSSTLYNCTLTGNSAWVGGGAYNCTLYNCTITGNSVHINPYGTGAPGACGGACSTLYNCISFNNYANGTCEDCDSPGRQGGDNWWGDPVFVDYANGNLRLQSNSPCINAGNNAYVTATNDLDGNPRIVGGTVDMGAYEYQGNALISPTVVTMPATAIGATNATLNGTVNPNGWPTTAWFQWGATTNYGNLSSATALGNGSTALPLSAALAGLTPGVTYHFRVAATNDYGLAYGSDQNFTTQAQSGGAGWTLNGGATMTGNTMTLTVGAGDTSRSAFLNKKQDITTFHIVFFYQDVSGAGSADGVTFCIQNDPRGATALGGGSGGSSLAYDNITPSVALAMNIFDPYTRGIAFAQNGARITPYQSLLPNVDIGGNTNMIQVNVDYNGTIMTMTFKDTVTGGIASTDWTVNIPSVVGGSTAYVGFTGADGGVASIQTISWGDSTPTILIPPRTQTAEAGSAVGLSVHASSALPLSFLWYLNDTNLISWSTNSDLELINVQSSNSGAYTVVVTNVAGAVTSAPVLVSVIAPVERRPVPGVKLMGEAGSLLNVDYSDSLIPGLNWTPLGSVSLTGTPPYCFDLTLPLPPQRSYRAWQTGAPSVRPSLDLHLVPAITLTGTIGGSVRLDYINQFGPTDAWVTLATVPLTNTSQLYFDISAPGQPPRLYRIVPVP